MSVSIQAHALRSLRCQLVLEVWLFHSGILPFFGRHPLVAVRCILPVSASPAGRVNFSEPVPVAGDTMTPDCGQSCSAPSMLYGSQVQLLLQT